MAIIKKPIKKTLFYLSSVFGLIFSLAVGLFFRNSEHNLSELENKAKNLFNIDLINKAKADIPGKEGCIGGCASAGGGYVGGDSGGDSGGGGDGGGCGGCGGCCSGGSDGTSGGGCGAGGGGDGGGDGGGGDGC